MMSSNQKTSPEETARAWKGWVLFTRAASASVVAAAAVLGLMAMFLV